MNNYFETMVRDAIRDGMSIDDIGNAVSSVLNKIKQDEPYIKRQELLDKIEGRFWTAIDKEKLEIEEVADLATLVCEADHPDWTAETIETFRDTIIKNIEITAKVMSDSPEQTWTNLVKESFNLFKGFSDKARAKRVEAAPIGKTDEDKVLNFLKQF